jgi:hypothetical protein
MDEGFSTAHRSVALCPGWMEAGSTEKSRMRAGSLPAC